MAKHLPFFKFDAEKWLSIESTVQLLTDAEKGTFTDLLAMIWVNKGRLENTAILARKLKVDEGTFKVRLATFMDLELISEVDGFLSVKFLKGQLKERSEFLNKCSASGRKSSAKRGKQSKVPPTKQKADIRKQKEEKESTKEKIAPEISSLPNSVKSLFTDFLTVSCSKTGSWPIDEIQRQWIIAILRWKDESVMIENMEKCISRGYKAVYDCREFDENKSKKDPHVLDQMPTAEEYENSSNFNGDFR